jgi:hypothetical protein
VRQRAFSSKRQRLRHARAPAARLDGVELDFPREMPVERFAQRRRFLARDVQALGRDEREMVAHDLQVHRVGAHPVRFAEFAADGERRERARGDAFVLRLK